MSFGAETPQCCVCIAAQTTPVPPLVPFSNPSPLSLSLHPFPALNAQFEDFIHFFILLLRIQGNLFLWKYPQDAHSKFLSKLCMLFFCNYLCKFAYWDLLLPKIGSQVQKTSGSSYLRRVFFIWLFFSPLGCNLSEGFRKNPQELHNFSNWCNK